MVVTVKFFYTEPLPSVSNIRIPTNMSCEVASYCNSLEGYVTDTEACLLYSQMDFRTSNLGLSEV